jgi:transcriptional regulator with XRE-family HTH domain
MSDRVLVGDLTKMTSPEPTASTVGERFAALRRARGLSQRAFATKLGISQPAIALIESGATVPRFETIRAAGEAFGVDLNVLILGRRW